MNIFCFFLYAFLLLGVLIVPVLFFMAAPYGRHFSANWGVGVNNRWAWVIMEFVSLLSFSFFFIFFLKPSVQWMHWFLFALWILHYTHRSLIFPFQLRSSQSKMPLLIMLNAVLFNVINGGLNGFYLGAAKTLYPENYYLTGYFILGFFLFLSGMIINISSDYYLISLRSENQNHYVIPKWRWFNYVSSPNYLGEIIEWIGFALMAQNMPAWVFAFWTVANLVPRAVTHHKWYKNKFPDYPKNRKAIIPFLF